MQNTAMRCGARLLAIVAAAGCVSTLLAADLPPGAADASPRPDTPGLTRALALLRPDYARYIASVRPLSAAAGHPVYMALERPGATDPAGPASSPFACQGARNDIVFDSQADSSGHRPAMPYLL